MTRRGILRAAAGLLAFAGTSSTATVAGADPLPKDVRKADARLEKPVSIESSRVLVGDLLKTWAEQTGVAINADAKAAAQPVAVVLSDVPLGDAMDALYSLLSYKDADWNWKATPGKDGTTYELFQPAAARLFATGVKKEIQDDFEAQFQAVIDFLNLPVEEREARKADAPTSPTGLQAIAAFLDVAPASKRSDVLRGEPLSVPLSDAPPSVRAFAEGQAQQFLKLNPHAEPPKYTLVQIEASKSRGDLAPSLMIMVGDETGYGGGAYVGGVPSEKRWQARLNDRWMLRGDSKQGALRPDTKLSALTPQQTQIAAEKEWGKLHHLSRMVPVSLMARLPDPRPLSRGSDNPMPTAGTALSAYLERMQDYGIAHKWRSGILLLANHAWMHKDDYESLPSWSLIQHLREVEAKAPGTPPLLSELVHTVASVSPEQMQHLLLDFPMFAAGATHRELFEFLHKSPALLAQIQSEEGVRLARVTPVRDSVPAPEGFIRLRVRDAGPPFNEEGPVYMVRIEKRVGTGEWKSDVGFSVTGRRKQSQETRRPRSRQSSGSVTPGAMTAP